MTKISSTKYFQWKYLHFITFSGIRLNIVLHQSDIFGISQVPYMSITLHLPGQDPIYQKKQLDFVWKKLKTTTDYNFEFNFENINFSGTVKVKPSDLLHLSFVLQSINKNQSSKWKVDYISAQFNAKLVVNNQVTFLEGYCYKDKQWGNLMLTDWVKSWNWFHLVNSSEQICRFEIVNQLNQAQEITIIHHNNAYQIMKRKFPYTPEPNHSLIVKDTTLEYEINNKKLTLNTAPTKIMRQRNERILDKYNFEYQRLFCDAQFNSQNLSGIIEFLTLEKI